MNFLVDWICIVIDYYLKNFRICLLIGAAAFAILFFACSGAGFQMAYPEYTEHRQFDATLLVMPLNSIIIDSSNTEEALVLSASRIEKFTWSELNYFNNYMGSALSEVTTARVLGIDPYFRLENIHFVPRLLTYADNYSLRIHCPESGVIRFNDITPDYVLFFEDLFFKKDYQESRNNIGNGTDKNYALSAGVEYLIWDNRHQQIAGFGKFAQYLNLLKYPTKETYIQLFEDYAEKIVAQSPLVRKY
jgi:hypothetical protein